MKDSRQQGFTLEIAGLRIALTTPDPEWAALLAERYAPFVVEGEAGWQAALIEDEAVPHEEPGWARHEGPVTAFHIFRYRGEIDLHARRAWVTAPAVPHAPSALERALTYILMQALPRERDGLLLHSCGVEMGGRGLVFCGPSGAGKTTTARLLRDHAELYGDENQALCLTDGGARLFSTPFWGASAPADLIARVNRSTPLAAICVLEHAPEFALRPLSPAEAITALLNTEKVATERVDSALAWLDVADRLVARVPVYGLRFRPTAELVDFLSRHFGT